jgi:hypothetical protein
MITASFLPETGLGTSSKPIQSLQGSKFLWCLRCALLYQRQKLDSNCPRNKWTHGSPTIIQTKVRWYLQPVVMPACAAIHSIVVVLVDLDAFNLQPAVRLCLTCTCSAGTCLFLDLLPIACSQISSRTYQHVHHSHVVPFCLHIVISMGSSFIRWLTVFAVIVAIVTDLWLIRHDKLQMHGHTYSDSGMTFLCLTKY